MVALFLVADYAGGATCATVMVGGLKRQTQKPEAVDYVASRTIGILASAQGYCGRVWQGTAPPNDAHRLSFDRYNDRDALLPVDIWPMGRSSWPDIA